MTLRCGSFLSLLCLSVAPGFAQQLVSTTPAPTERQITLDVAVNEKSGAPVPGLQQQDFTLLDNKQPQTITSFKAITGAAEPIQVILVVDEVNTVFSRVAYERDEIERYFKRDGGALPVPISLAYLSDKGLVMGGTATKDGNALIAAMNDNKNGLRTVTRSQGFYGAAERLELSLRGLEQIANYEMARPGRKIVVWISPGWPLLSGPRIEMTSKDQQNYFASVVNFSYLLRRAGITLYSVDPLGTSDSGGFRTFYYEAFLKGVKKPSQVQLGNLALQVLATQSGGRVFNSNNDVASEIANCVRDTTAYYEVTFEGLRGDGPNDYHPLEMKVDKPGLTAHTRTGYYAQP
jgi:VWFA-related protein